MRILVVEDDKSLADHVVRGLAALGYQVDCAFDGDSGLQAALDGGYDVLVVDRMLPGLQGLDIVASLRERHSSVPVLILSALGEVDDRVAGLRAGGDDYLTKPFAMEELGARIEALSRRGRTAERASDATLAIDSLILDRLRRTVYRDGTRIDLQPREFQLLEFLMARAGQVVTRTMLLEGVWNYHFNPQTNIIDVHISRLRSKVDRDFDQPLIETIRGVGYRIAGNGDGSGTSPS